MSDQPATRPPWQRALGYALLVYLLLTGMDGCSQAIGLYKVRAFAATVDGAMNSVWSGHAQVGETRRVFEETYIRRLPFYDRASPTFWLVFSLTKKRIARRYNVFPPLRADPFGPCPYIESELPT